MKKMLEILGVIIGGGLGIGVGLGIAVEYRSRSRSSTPNHLDENMARKILV
jgi:hypothetical protein